MSRFSVSLLFALLLAAGCSPSAEIMTSVPTTTPAPPPTPERPLPAPVVPPAEFAEAVAAGTRTTRGLPGPGYWTQTAEYGLTARLLPDARRLEGTARIVYHNNAPDTLRRLHVELAQNLHAPGVVRNTVSEMTGGVDLRRVAVDGRTLSADAETGPRYDVDGTQLVLRPTTPLAPGGTATIEIEWAFTIPQAGASGRMGYSGPGGATTSAPDLFFLAYWYPQMAVYDDVLGWHTDPFQGQAEFYHDFADYDLTIEAPEGWIVWSTGTLQNAEEVLAPEVLARLVRARASDVPVEIISADEAPSATARTSPGGFVRWHYTADDVRDVAFSATRRSTWEAARTPVGDRDGDGRTDYASIHTFYRPEAPLWSQVTRYQQHAIAFLSDYTGFSYPWPHMTAVEGAGIIGGGMEFPMMTLMGDYNTRGDSALYYVTAHELAHMWIPLLVSSNERRFSWMDEGTTTFHENQARKDFYPGPDHEAPDRDTYLRVARAGREGEIMRRSDFHYPGSAFGVASYQKPASLLSALRGLLGEETFHRGLRAFIADWAYKHPYPYDLFNTFERVSGRDLDWFWHAWYYETWTLDQAVADVRWADGQTTIIVEDRGYAPMPARLVVTLADGTTLRREVPVETWLRGATEAAVTLPTGALPVRVEIDPEQLFPDVERTNNVWTAE